MLNLRFHTSLRHNDVVASAESTERGITRFTLEATRWDDYGFKSSFELYLILDDGPVWIGVTKIGKLGSYAGFGVSSHSTVFDSDFTQIPEGYISLGQDPEFYSNLMRQFTQNEVAYILTALNDVTRRDDLRLMAVNELVVRKSLLRTLTIETVEDQYRRIISGGAETDSFTLTYYDDPENAAESATTHFKVEAGESLPGTLQIVIGSNGAGKTRMLRNISDSFTSARPGHVHISDGKRVSGLVKVGFSAFDIETTPTQESSDEALRVRKLDLTLLSPENATDEASTGHQSAFDRLVEACASAGRSERVLAAVATLAQTDQLLNEHDLTTIESLRAIPFGSMSSGHKIVLLTVAGLVASCDDRTLILIDEPESHLHPPLLASFITAIRDLIADTNSLAIVATHSPVVLQQVPARHSRKIWRSGQTTQFLGMASETWGENLGRLTRAVFKVELERSGHYSLLHEAASGRSYDEALEYLGGEIGDEASLILQSLTDQEDAS